MNYVPFFFPAGEIYAAGFKAAGVASQQTASAAAAFLLQDAANNWMNIDRCWIGGFVGT